MVENKWSLFQILTCKNRSISDLSRSFGFGEHAGGLGTSLSRRKAPVLQTPISCTKSNSNRNEHHI